MARRSLGNTRSLVPAGQISWPEQDEDERAAVAADADDDADDGSAADLDDDAVDIDESDELDTETAVLDDPDNVGDQTVDLNVDALVAELEADITPASRQAARRTPGGARRQLEDFWERKRVARAIEDLEDFEV
jgi:hypothetical protein